MAKKLSKRLLAIAEMVDPGAYLADVGSDHALLPIHLVSTGKISWAQAIENKTGPFLHMQSAVTDAGLSSHIGCSKSDGISSLYDGVDEIAICGMGGLLSCDILEAHPEKLACIKAIIMDPHRDLIAVRKRVTALGFHIADETMVNEDKVFYSIIKFVKGKPTTPYTNLDLSFGPVLRKKRGETYERWIALQLKKTNLLLNQPLSKEAREHYLAVYRALRDELKANQSDSK